MAKPDIDIKTIDRWLLIVIVAICGGFTVFSIVAKNTEYYSLLACGFLFAIALHLIFSTFIEKDIYRKIDNIEQNIINSVGCILQKFENTNLTNDYIATRIATAKKCVYDFNWQDDTSTEEKRDYNPNGYVNPVDKEFSQDSIDKQIKSFCSSKGSRLYREVFTFSYPVNIHKMKAHIGYGGNNYECKYFDNLPPNHKFPKLQFVIIDDEEVIFASSAYAPYLYAIKGKNFVHMFCCYFNQAWGQAKEIKVKNKRQEDIDRIISDIETRYASKN